MHLEAAAYIPDWFPDDYWDAFWDSAKSVLYGVYDFPVRPAEIDDDWPCGYVAMDVAFPHEFLERYKAQVLLHLATDFKDAPMIAVDMTPRYLAVVNAETPNARNKIWFKLAKNVLRKFKGGQV